jgi:murein DD-endopeptidase MepM/ murein hydrolase activator NlpD
MSVKTGDLVMRGQKIAAVGSTGRSTGPHRHFEVRLNGAPQNPARFLQASNLSSN